jgi:16S rRNA (uracil1498-N3)-methyltransferase
MLPRFLGAIDVGSATAHLAEDEARHLTQVLRLAIGDEVAVFDGDGREFRARVVRASRDGADLSLLDASVPAPEPAVRLTLAQAALKGDKMDDVVRDATMMGVAAIEPLVTAHTVAHMKPGNAPERWRRVAIASAKQCRRAVVPAIGVGLTLNEWIARDAAEAKLMLLEPALGAEKLSGANAPEDPAEGHTEYTDLRRVRPASASLLVGPEGGWSAAEVDLARRAGYRPLTLGRRTLRADAVPIVAISVLQYLWGDI